MDGRSTGYGYLSDWRLPPNHTLLAKVDKSPRERPPSALRSEVERGTARNQLPPSARSDPACLDRSIGKHDRNVILPRPCVRSRNGARFGRTSRNSCHFNELCNRCRRVESRRLHWHPDCIKSAALVTAGHLLGFPYFTFFFLRAQAPVG
jgi:hypothetical protein